MLPGFFDGDDTWKIRFSPTVEGKWSFVTRSDITDLDGKRMELLCTPNKTRNVHGGLLIDQVHSRHFVYEDGTRYFMMGYECDWLWALDSLSDRNYALDKFLSKLAANGFNNIIMNSYAHDTAWRVGNTDPDDYGPPPFYAWEGTNEVPNHSRFNLKYWKHYDKVIESLNRHGITAHIMIKVYNKMVNWPRKGSPEDDLFFRWMIARYAAYPNVHWDLSKEANNEPDVMYKTDRLRFIRANDPYHRLVTVHDDRATYDKGVYAQLADYRSDQQHSDWSVSMAEHRMQKEWPIVNVEFGYEHGPGGIKDVTYNVSTQPKELCRRAWEICMAGGYTAYYYTYTAWDVVRPADTPPGYAYFRRLRSFFDTIPYWRMIPTNDLVDRGQCLADPGKTYVVLLSESQPLSLNIRDTRESLKAEWLQPFTGARISAGHIGPGKIKLDPPKAWGDGPIVLHVY